MRWIDALKEWNAGSAKWCIPKKGTEDYDAVRALMGPKAEKEKKVKAEAPKEAKAPKASLKDMAAAVGVPMKTMKSAAADYYKRVDNAQDPERGLLIERMPAQLRAGWEKHQASKEPAAPVVRRVLKKKPVMVAVPEAPAAPAIKSELRAYYDKMSGAERAQYDIAKQRRNRAAIAYYEKTYPFLKEEEKRQVSREPAASAAPVVRRVLKKKPTTVAVPEAPAAPAPIARRETRDERERRLYFEERERFGRDRAERSLGNLQRYWLDMVEGRTKKTSAFKQGVLEDVESALLRYPRASIPEYAMKMFLKTAPGKDLERHGERPKRFLKRGGRMNKL